MLKTTLISLLLVGLISGSTNEGMDLPEKSALVAESLDLPVVRVGLPVQFRMRIKNQSKQDLLLYPIESKLDPSIKIYSKSPLSLRAGTVKIIPCRIDTRGFDESYDLEIPFSYREDRSTVDFTVPLKGRLDQQ